MDDQSVYFLEEKFLHIFAKNLTKHEKKLIKNPKVRQVYLAIVYDMSKISEYMGIAVCNVNVI